MELLIDKLTLRDGKSPYRLNGKNIICVSILHKLFEFPYKSKVICIEISDEVIPNSYSVIIKRVDCRDINIRWYNDFKQCDFLYKYYRNLYDDLSELIQEKFNLKKEMPTELYFRMWYYE